MAYTNEPAETNDCDLLPPRTAKGSRRGVDLCTTALRSAEGPPRRSTRALRRPLKVIGVSLLALAVGEAAPSWAQTLPPCRATDAAITDVSPAPSDVNTLIADCTALLTAFPFLYGTAPVSTNGWIRTIAIDDWDFVTLSADNSRVARLEIPSNNPKLNGTIPDLSVLTGLQVLNLSGNELTGTIPDLSALTGLQVLNLNGNKLTGAFPDLSALTGLQVLALNGNKLTGAIPDPSALTGLVTLWLQDNSFTGSIPDLSALTSLQVLQLQDNSLTGSIPPLSGLTSLDEITLARMNLTGSIPSLTGLTTLRAFDVSENRLTGQVPSLTGLTNLESFNANDNALTGALPPLTGLANLEILAVGTLRTERGFGNSLEGPIPSLDGLTRLAELVLSGNRLTGPIPDLSDLAALNVLRLGNNRLSGPLPAPSSSATVSELSVENNLLTGDLPDLSAFTTLVDVSLASNSLTGSIAWMGSLAGLERLSLCFNDFDESQTLPAALETRRTADDLNVLGCLRIDEDVSGSEGTDLTFNVTHSSWPLREQHGLSVVYNTVDQTASPLDYGATSSSALTIPVMGANEFTKSAAITVPIHVDSVDEYDETFLLNLVNAYKLESPQGTASGNTLRNAGWTATGTILGAGPPGSGPGPGPSPDPGPAPDPDPDPDPGPDPAACDRLVAPYWRGAGGIAVTPKNGRSAVFRHSCRGAETTETLYANEAGLIVQLLNRDACTDDAGKVISTEVSVEGVEDGGWYWIDGDRNSAVAPLLCEVQLGGSRAAVPAGVSTDVTADATLFEHHASRLLGIVPHLQSPAAGACSAYVAPYWKGTGGMVVSATDGESAQLTNTCGGISKTQTLKANDAGLIVQLLGEAGSESNASTCTDGAGKALRSDLSIAGVEPGGWYWLNGARNAAVAPLACADQLGGSKATVPAGVDADATAAGTLFEHHVAKLIGIVPHLRRE